MTPASRRSRLLAFTLLATLALSACGVARPDAAVVDGDPITDEQLASDIVLFEFLASLNGGPCGQAIEGETGEAACARFALSNLIQEGLIRHYAEEHDVSVPHATVTEALDQLESSIGAEELDRLLTESELTRNELDAFAGRLLLFDEVQRAVGAEAVTDEQLRDRYDQNVNEYTQLHAAHILLQTEAEAQEIAAKATPKNFAELARKFSIDPSAQENGGDLGTVPASGAFDPVFVEAALALEPGEIGAPVETQFGWHVIWLISVEVTPFDQVRGQLIALASGGAFQEWLMDRFRTAEITVNPKYGRLDVESGQIVPIRSTATGTPSPAASPSAPDAP